MHILKVFILLVFQVPTSSSPSSNPYSTEFSATPDVHELILFLVTSKCCIFKYKQLVSYGKYKIMRCRVQKESWKMESQHLPEKDKSLKSQNEVESKGFCPTVAWHWQLLWIIMTVTTFHNNIKETCSCLEMSALSQLLTFWTVKICTGEIPVLH